MNQDSIDKKPLSLWVIFITLFVDLVGFSVIFPLYPAMLEHYFALEGSEGVLGTLLSWLEQAAVLAGGGDARLVVLFGGFLGSLYALLQFVCAPIVGKLSDRYGRKPLLIISTAGLSLSYLLWVFAGSFWLLILSRFLGGVMSGNISTATAAVADVTSGKERSRGMAIIGMAFGLGFVMGPAIGGIASFHNMAAQFPALTAYGINPFSLPALIAFFLALSNFLFVVFVFKETKPAHVKTLGRPQRTFNLKALFGSAGYPGVSRTNLAYFLFITAFSGMEFSLSFLAEDRFNYTPGQIAAMLVFIGVTLAAVQGSYVRARSSEIGERRMATQGFIIAIPGLYLLGIAQSQTTLYLGNFLVAVGAAQVIPCLTALVSMYTPSDVQGRTLGIFRSLGALGRVIGPLIICVVYWQFGSLIAYVSVATFMIWPLFMMRRLPEPPQYSQYSP